MKMKIIENENVLFAQFLHKSYIQEKSFDF